MSNKCSYKLLSSHLKNKYSYQYNVWNIDEQSLEWRFTTTKKCSRFAMLSQNDVDFILLFFF